MVAWRDHGSLEHLGWVAIFNLRLTGKRSVLLCGGKSRCQDAGRKVALLIGLLLLFRAHFFHRRFAGDVAACFARRGLR